MASSWIDRHDWAILVAGLVLIVFGIALMIEASL